MTEIESPKRLNFFERYLSLWVLLCMVVGIALGKLLPDAITIPGIINIDFADIRAVLDNAGSALMGIGTSRGDNRATEAARSAVSSPLLESSIEGATGILLNITGGPDVGLFEVNEAFAGNKNSFKTVVLVDDVLFSARRASVACTCTLGIASAQLMDSFAGGQPFR